jgi:Domain of unknown function (DUF1735)
MKMKLFFIAILSTVVLSSCLKSEDPFGWNADKGSIVSEIFDRSYYGELKVIALEATPPTETFDMIELKFYAPRSNKPASDIQATLVLMPSLVAANGLNALPAAAYSIPSLTLTIPKNGGVVAVPMTLNKTLLNLALVYGIAFKLTTVSEGIISDLSNEITVAFIIKNAYHANYTVNGYFFHPSAGSSRAISNLVKGMSTLGAQRVQGQVGDLGGWNFQFDISGSALSGWASYNGANPPSPPASGFFVADNPGAITYPDAPPGPGTAPYLQTTYNNTYNPATKTFYLHYGYGGGATSPNGWSRNIYEIWVRN